MLTPTKLDTPCREYMGARDHDGYGLRYVGKRMTRVHRWVMEQIVGSLRRDQLVLHRCDNPPCMRFDHLFVGTHAINNADRAAKGRSAHTGRFPHLTGERHSQAKLTQVQVDEIRRRVAAGEVQRAIAREFAVSPATICLLVSRKNWA